VKPPERRGFGLRLVEDVLAQDLRGEVKINFAADGLECTIVAPLKATDTEKLRTPPVAAA
jgi:two-component sensor histidine kinase